MKVRTAIAITAGIIAVEAAITWFALSAWSSIPVRHWPPNRWHIELGNLSEALAAFAATGAAFVALWIAGQERRDRKQEREEEARTHALLVHLDIGQRTVLRQFTTDAEPVPVVEVKIRNFGPLPVLDVAITGATCREYPEARRRATIQNGRSYNILRPHTKDSHTEEMTEFSVEFLHPDEDRTVVPITGRNPGKLPNGKRIPIYAKIDLAGVLIKVQFTTASGIRWESAIQGNIRGKPIRVV